VVAYAASAFHQWTLLPMRRFKEALRG